ncbi:NAD(P)-dependent alcohol dehydrogenase [Sphingobium lactosutens]|uniref:NAD(P)-dependent alcohol dehydrogenase n=1 Tax=Sphingobium lactosutens TaxID=522773 RepID=UPI0015BA37D9|nr:NAD(P)-dependent alcohol dehydrogenase [Sphingobium lactosutens]NWK96269.1 NAD(P)-dependent alcohol dehydrogenase [Sphingobium lactosutens]
MESHGAVARGAGRPFSFEKLDVAPPRAGEVLVRIAGVGLCHTDLIFRDQFVPYPVPAVLGHEGAGTIEALGEGVDGLKVGDAVVLAFSSCGHCPRCEEQLPSYCQQFPALNYAGARLEDGSTAYSAGEEAVASHFFGQSSFARHAVVRTRNVVKVEKASAPLELLGTLACGFQTGAGAVLNAMDCPEGSAVVIFGGGPVGMAAVMAAALRGCAPIILVEPIAARREVALDLGATHVLDPSDPDLPAAIRAIVPAGVDFALDTSGQVSAVEAGIASLTSHGTLGMVGVPKTAETILPVNLTAAITYGHRIIGIMEGDSDPQRFIPELLAYHAAGQFPFDRLIETFPLERINEAVAAQARGDCIKAVLLP